MEPPLMTNEATPLSKKDREEEEAEGIAKPFPCNWEVAGGEGGVT